MRESLVRSLYPRPTRLYTRCKIDHDYSWDESPKYESSRGDATGFLCWYRCFCCLDIHKIFVGGYPYPRHAKIFSKKRLTRMRRMDFRLSLGVQRLTSTWIKPTKIRERAYQRGQIIYKSKKSKSYARKSLYQDISRRYETMRLLEKFVRETSGWIMKLRMEQRCYNRSN